MSVNKISENYGHRVYYTADASAGLQLPADGQSATDNYPAGWIDIRDVEKGQMLYHTIDGASNATTIRIISNSASNGGGSDSVVKTLTNPTNIDAASETAMLEWTASDIADGDRYITADLNQATAQTCVVSWILEYRRDKKTGLTTATETAST